MLICASLSGPLEELGLVDANPVRLPIAGGDMKSVEVNQDPKLVNPTAYRNIIGKLMYATVGTRPDIAFAVGVLGRFTANPNMHHFKMAQRAVAYLKGTKDAYLHFKIGKGALKIEGYADTNWGGNHSDRRSTTGYTFLVNGCPVSWSSKRQVTVALSSTEAEYMAATQATKEAIWIQHHFVQEQVESGEVELKPIPTSHQLADVLTKALTRDRFTALADKLIKSLF